LLAALDVLVARCSGQRDVLMMVPTACRQRFLAGAVVGFFANMVVLRTEVPPRLSFAALVRRVNAEILAGVLRQDVPFEKVVDALRPDRSLSHDPLARMACSFLPAGAATLDLPGVEATYEEIPNGGSKFDLHFVITDHADALTVSAEHSVDIFDRGSIEALLGRYRLLLEGACERPDAEVADLPLLAPEERRRLLVELNDTRRDHGPGGTLPDLFAAAAARAPDAPALSCAGRETSYRELDAWSNRIAHALRARGGGPGRRVG